MRILLIHTAFLGDLVLASPLIRAAAELSERGKVDLVTSPAGAAVTSGHPLVEALLVYEKRGRDRGLAGLARVIRWIRNRRPDVVLLPSRSIRSPLLAWVSGVKRRIGFARGLARFLCTDSVVFDPALHHVERNLDLLRPLGAQPAVTGRPGHPLEVFPSAEDRRAVEAWLVQEGLSVPGSFFAVAPGSTWATKRWPAERFAALAGRMLNLKDVVLTGGPGERDLSSSILTMVAEESHGEESVHASGARRGRGAKALPCTSVLHQIHDATGRFSPPGSVHLMARSALLVSNDSGALHLGQAAGVPVLGVFGPTTSGMGYVPRGPHDQVVGVQGLSCRPCGRHGARRCPQRHWRCMLDLDSDMVYRLLTDVLEGAA